MSDSTISSLKEKLNTPTWHLVLLATATYGIYPLMWLYKNQDTIMDEVGQRFSSGTFIVWMAVCSGVSVMLNLLFPVQVDQYGYAYDSSAQMMAGLAFLISLAWIVLTIVWAFKARASL